MIATPQTLHVPLWTDDDGKLRVDGTRVLLETVINAFQQGENPEGIVDSFPTLNLVAVYGVIAYYLSHRAEVDAYMQQVRAAGERIRQRIEADTPAHVAALRARLRAARQS